eukprot:TRINITY_DN1137_c0_g1_i3.p1 TRINITY_DN1137_c0_g1~~TRINITY_DN1137_c0_g1_i3.p1  ORF type:complete len:361 (+),score=51.32 TRINITY_DN1137_c0_g1_i3:545-1627(+)
MGCWTLHTATCSRLMCACCVGPSGTGGMCARWISAVAPCPTCGSASYPTCYASIHCEFAELTRQRVAQASELPHLSMGVEAKQRPRYTLYDSHWLRTSTPKADLQLSPEWESQYAALGAQAKALFAEVKSATLQYCQTAARQVEVMSQLPGSAPVLALLEGVEQEALEKIRRGDSPPEFLTQRHSLASPPGATPTPSPVKGGASRRRSQGGSAAAAAAAVPPSPATPSPLRLTESAEWPTRDEVLEKKCKLWGGRIKLTFFKEPGINETPLDESRIRITVRMTDPPGDPAGPLDILSGIGGRTLSQSFSLQGGGSGVGGASAEPPILASTTLTIPVGTPPEKKCATLGIVSATNKRDAFR